MNDNREHCSVSIRGDDALYCVVDGSTRTGQSGGLASAFVEEIANRFAAERAINSVESVCLLLCDLSGKFKKPTPQAG